MSYRFETTDKNYEDFASGKVFYNQQGTTSFPVRLASEIFLRCEHILKAAGAGGPYSIYDPCCGGAYLVATLGFLHGDRISQILASDIDESIVALAQRNLSLLTLAGIEQRMEQIGKMLAEFGKPSHKDALKSAVSLKEILLSKNVQTKILSFAADATKEKPIKEKIDIVITDLPYGQVVQWSGQQEEHSAVKGLLDTLIPVLADNSIAAVVSGKKTVVKHERYKRVEQFKIGKRQVTFLQPIL